MTEERKWKVAAIIPGVVAIYVAGIVAQVCVSITRFTINEMVLKCIQICGYFWKCPGQKLYFLRDYGTKQKFHWDSLWRGGEGKNSSGSLNYRLISGIMEQSFKKRMTRTLHSMETYIQNEENEGWTWRGFPHYLLQREGWGQADCSISWDRNQDLMLWVVRVNEANGEPKSVEELYFNWHRFQKHTFIWQKNMDFNVFFPVCSVWEEKKNRNWSGNFGKWQMQPMKREWKWFWTSARLCLKAFAPWKIFAFQETAEK